MPSPADMAGNLQRFLLGIVLPSASCAHLTRMVNCQTGTARVHAGLALAWKVVDRTGNNDADARGDIAVAWLAPDRQELICVYI